MTILNLIGIVIGGAVIGALARLVMPGRQNIPIWATIIAGIVGMLVGNYLAVLLGVRHTGGIDWIRHILQVVVAVLAVAGVGAIMGRSKT
jgi:uncharacterized membrane protein YeaQ/YmgE (transglycosylase-associated protein family)